MTDVHLAITTDQKPALVNLVRRLPAMLSGRLPDEHNIAQGFRTRLGYALLSLIAPNFEELSRGMPGADGTKWPPLSKEYLAYGRRFGQGEKAALRRQAGLRDKDNHSLAPGDKKGLLTPDQLKLWRRTYARAFAKYILQTSEESASSHAAAVAWITVKAAGAKTKLEVYGNRQVQMLVDTGYLRNSLQPGQLNESGPDASYTQPGGDGGSQQLFETDSPYSVSVGSHVNYSNYHHNAKNPNRRRRLWPSSFPPDWWRQILGIAVQGLSRISEIYRNGGI